MKTNCNPKKAKRTDKKGNTFGGNWIWSTYEYRRKLSFMMMTFLMMEVISLIETCAWSGGNVKQMLPTLVVLTVSTLEL